jgi:hypothetical protein
MVKLEEKRGGSEIQDGAENSGADCAGGPLFIRKRWGWRGASQLGGALNGWIEYPT